MAINLGMVRPGSTIQIPFNTFDSNDPSASVAIAAFIAGDIEVYKDGVATTRASDSGYTLLDTDGIDFDSHVGIGGFSIDLADNSTAGFYAAGSRYMVIVGPTTVDAGVVNFVAATFEIGYPDAILNTTIASLTSATQFILTDGPAEADVFIGSTITLHDVASKVQLAFGVVSDYIVTTKEVFLVGTPVGFTPAATDNVSIFVPVNVAAWLGTAPATPTVAGVPEVDVTHQGGGAVPAPAVTGVPDVNLTHHVDVAASVSNGELDVNVGSWLGTVAATPSVAGVPEVDITHQGGGAIPAPAVTGVPDVNLTHHVDVAASVSSGSLDVNVETEDNIDFGATKKTSITTQVVQALKDGGLVLSSSTIETVTNQTNFIIPNTADATDDNAYNDLTAVFIDGSDANQVSVRSVINYTASTRSIEIDSAPDFTVTNSDTIVLLSSSNARAVWNRVLTGSTHNISQSSGRRLRGIQEFAGYALGAIWIDTVNGVAGTVDFENGTVDNPVDSIADANTLATSLKINRFFVAPKSSITFAAAQEDQEFIGRNWTLALGGQSISNSHFTGADVTGTGTSAVEAHFDHCEMGDCTLGICHIDSSDIEGTITCSAAGTYFMLGCYHAGAAIIDFGTGIGNTTFHVHDYHGALIVLRLGETGTDILHFSSSDGKLTTGTTNVAGTMNLNGVFDFVDTSTGTTINQDGRVNRDVSLILTDTAVIGALGVGLTDLGGMSTAMKAEINAEALDVLVTDTFAEPAQGQPGNTISIEEKISFIYAALINEVDVDSTLKEFSNAAGTVIWKKTVSDDGSNYNEAKGATGP